MALDQVLKDQDFKKKHLFQDQVLINLKALLQMYPHTQSLIKKKIIDMSEN